ncbi:MAG: Na-translocating system protein MpsC family protein [Solirubrobacteraceae bacterium]
MDADQATSADGSGSGMQHQGMLSAVSNEMVRIYKDQFGRGPTKTRSNWAGPDVLVVTLEDTFTPAERSLRKMGEHKQLRDLRMLFQYAEISAFCDPVERLTGRKVRAFLSAIDTETDLATEMFVLHPVDYDGPSRSALGSNAVR